MSQDMLQDKRFDFTILENDIVRDTEKFSKNELLAYIAICYHADKAGTCFPSYDGIARIMRTSRTTAINAIQGLVEKGVIKLENRKADEKKKELTSNLYTLVSNQFWEQVESENRKYLTKKGIDYKNRYRKGQATKLANENTKKDKEKAPDSTAIEPSATKESFKSFNNNIVAHEGAKSTEESSDKNVNNTTNNQDMSEELKKRMDILNRAKIKYVPYKSEPELIEGLDLEILQRAVDITVEQSTSRSWKYVLPTYDSECVKIHRAKEEEPKTGFKPNFKPRFKGGIGMCSSNWDGKDLYEWDEDEFNKAVERKQKEKWGNR